VKGMAKELQGTEKLRKQEMFGVKEEGSELGCLKSWENTKDR